MTGFIFNGLPAGFGQNWGWVDYNDTATLAAPIDITLADTWYPVTNDGLGGFSDDTHKIAGHTDIWNTATNVLEFTNLKYGDVVDYRLDFLYTAGGNNSEFFVGLELGIGGSSYILPVFHSAYKTISEKQVGRSSYFYMDTANTLNNTGRFVVKSDVAGGSLKNNGWMIRTNVI